MYVCALVACALCMCFVCNVDVLIARLSIRLHDQTLRSVVATIAHSAIFYMRVCTFHMLALAYFAAGVCSLSHGMQMARYVYVFALVTANYRDRNMHVFY